MSDVKTVNFPYTIPSPNPRLHRPFQVKILDDRITPDMLIPERPMSAGIDLRACIDKPIELHPHQAILIPTGIACWIGMANYVGLIYPRSGAGHKRGLVLGNGVGVIDADYQGQWYVSACNRNNECVITIEPMERIAQAVFAPCVRPDFCYVDEFTDATERGEGGFGSTGK